MFDGWRPHVTAPGSCPGYGGSSEWTYSTKPDPMSELLTLTSHLISLTEHNTVLQHENIELRSRLEKAEEVCHSANNWDALDFTKSALEDDEQGKKFFDALAAWNEHV